MRTILRIALLCIFAAAGVGLAISLVVHTDPQHAGPDSPLTQLLARLPHTSPGNVSLSTNAPPHGISASERSPTDGASTSKAATTDRNVVPLNEVGPSRAELQGPVAQQMELLQNTLQRVEDANKQSQIERLERTLERVQLAAERNERLLTESQTRRVAQVARPSGAEDAPPGAEDTPSESLPLPAQSNSQPQITPGAGDGELMINVKNSDIRDVLDYLSEQTEINILASPNVHGTVTASLSNVSVQEAVAALLQLTGFVFRQEGNFLYVGTPADLQAMDQLRDKIATRVYRPNYVSAADLQILVTPVLTQTIGRVTVSTRSQVDIPASTTQTGGDSFAQNEVLLVRDYESVLLQVDAIVADVDKPPRQVMIEAMILSVSLDDSTKMGVNLEALVDKNHARIVSGSPLVNLGNIDVTEGGLNFGFLDSSLGVFIDALDTVGDTEVIAAPRLMCLNKQRAEILIGDQKGYLNTTQTETATTQTVQFLDVGTQLRIRPFISSDGTIRMEIHPELSTGDVKLLGTFALPEKSVTQVTTNIMCRDGATVVIGGLIRDDISRNINQIPLLGNMPLLGPMFRHKNDSVQRNEIIVVITPHIVHDPMALDDGHMPVAEMHRRQAKVFVDRMTPVARRYYSNRYLRLAKSSFMAGDTPSAMSYVDLALHFTPRRFEALNLRDEIVTGGPNSMDLIEAMEFGDEVEIPPLPYIEETPVAPGVPDASGARESAALPNPPLPPPDSAGRAPARLPAVDSPQAARSSRKTSHDASTSTDIRPTSLLRNIGPPPLGAPLP